MTLATHALTRPAAPAALRSSAAGAKALIRQARASTADRRLQITVQE